MSRYGYGRQASVRPSLSSFSPSVSGYGLGIVPNTTKSFVNAPRTYSTILTHQTLSTDASYPARMRSKWHCASAVGTYRRVRVSCPEAGGVAAETTSSRLQEKSPRAVRSNNKRIHSNKPLDISPDSNNMKLCRIAISVILTGRVG